MYFDNFEGGFIVANYKAPVRGSQIYLRLRRVGTTYTGYFSEDGENWITLGEHTRDFSEARLGLMAAQAAESIPASFDYFTITSLPE
jgi:beta-xylosidase